MKYIYLSIIAIESIMIGYLTFSLSETNKLFKPNDMAAAFYAGCTISTKFQSGSNDFTFCDKLTPIFLEELKKEMNK